MELLAAICFFLASHAGGLLVGGFMLTVAVIVVRSAKSDPPLSGQNLESLTQRRSPLRLIPSGLPLVLAILNFFAGDAAAKALVHRLGAPGTGTVLSVRGTSTRVNQRQVLAYAVLLKSADGTVTETEFTDMSDLFQPSLESPDALPAPGQTFGTRSLPNYPWAFTILTDDANPYAVALHCGALGRALEEAQHRHTLVPEDRAQRVLLADRIDAFLTRGCASTGGDGLREQSVTLRAP